MGAASRQIDVVFGGHPASVELAEKEVIEAVNPGITGGGDVAEETEVPGELGVHGDFLAVLAGSAIGFGKPEKVFERALAAVSLADCLIVADMGILDQQAGGFSEVVVAVIVAAAFEGDAVGVLLCGGFKALDRHVPVAGVMADVPLEGIPHAGIEFDRFYVGGERVDFFFQKTVVSWRSAEPWA